MVGLLLLHLHLYMSLDYLGLLEHLLLVRGWAKGALFGAAICSRAAPLVHLVPFFANFADVAGGDAAKFVELGPRRYCFTHALGLYFLVVGVVTDLNKRALLARQDLRDYSRGVLNLDLVHGRLTQGVTGDSPTGRLPARLMSLFLLVQ